MPAGYKTRLAALLVSSTPARPVRMERSARVVLHLHLLLPLLMESLVGAQVQPGMRPNALLRGSDSTEPRGSDQRQHQTRPPLLMMQLYRTMLTEDPDRDRDLGRDRTAAARVSHTVEESNPALHDSDAVISLVAKSEYWGPYTLHLPLPASACVALLPLRMLMHFIIYRFF